MESISDTKTTVGFSFLYPYWSSLPPSRYMTHGTNTFFKNFKFSQPLILVKSCFIEADFRTMFKFFNTVWPLFSSVNKFIRNQWCVINRIYTFKYLTKKSNFDLGSINIVFVTKTFYFFNLISGFHMKINLSQPEQIILIYCCFYLKKIFLKILCL